MAIQQSLDFMNEDYQWIVDIDLERFFGTVNHDRLMNLVSRTIEDGDVISLIRKFLVSIRTDDGLNTARWKSIATTKQHYA